MYKIIINFPNVSFIVKSEKEDAFKKQMEHIAEFNIKYDYESEKKIEIEYIENEELFNKYIKDSETQKSIAYQTFTNQIHREYKMSDGKSYYIVDNKEYVCIKENENSYKILTNGQEKSVKWLFRIVREILVRINEENNALYMHGTAIKTDDKDILILGNSGSGKTTLATKLLEYPEPINFLSNDRIFLYDSNNNPNIEYFPIPVVYAMGTVKNCQNLDKYFKNTRILEKRTGIKYEKSNYDIKVDVPLLDLERIFPNCKLIPKTNLNLIIFAKLNKYVDKDFVIRKLTEKEKRIRLDQTCFTPMDWESLRLEWIYRRNINESDLIGNKIDVFENLINDTEIVELEYGLNVNNKKLIKEIRRL